MNSLSDHAQARTGVHAITDGFSGGTSQSTEEEGHTRWKERGRKKTEEGKGGCLDVICSSSSAITQASGKGDSREP